MPPQASRRRPEGGDGYAADGVDRLSDLPEELRLEILGRLGSAREAACTSVLSHRWRGLWTRLPDLAFRGVGIGSVEAALAQLAGSPALDLLNVCVEEHVNPERISSLLRAAAPLAPKNLTIASEYGPRGEGAVDLPCLDRTASLTISLVEMSLAPPQAGEFAALTSLSIVWSCIDVAALLPLCPWLRVLHLQKCFELGAHAVLHLPLLEELLLREDFLESIDIDAPVLKKVEVEVFVDEELSVSFSAPMVELFDWVLVYHQFDVAFGRLWRMNSVRELRIQGYLPCVEIQLQADPDLSDQDWFWDFAKAIAQLRFPNFSVLELDILAEGHVFGPMVLHLLRIRPVIQMLRISMEENDECKVKFPCSRNCLCKQPNNWRSESVALTGLEEIEIVGLKGKDHEVDFLKLLLRCATKLERMTVRLYDGVSPSKSECTKIRHVFKEYPDVECVVYSKYDKGSKTKRWCNWGQGC
ncbi:hypothetical protein SEVIR_2G324900v4 [Setaria viridis]|uniref:FBD domain-containing protein n=1 Tax=Setaria viridis TaxID=4556 RepID=A0A4U6W2G5_SETVI|nr:uncharacterized protein LOC117846097 [Setaria viridis]XP_034583090.1 uncharacterized protein LOC117846097 [Setaria viridis]TKW34729.1 hypothetical protein SEVIR_2G324900v2 [Setaria viridis]